MRGLHEAWGAQGNLANQLSDVANLGIVGLGHRFVELS